MASYTWISPVPRGTPVIQEGQTTPRWKIHEKWDNWCQELARLLNGLVSVVLGSTSLTAQDASVGPTSLNMGTLAAGLYRVTYYQTISVPGTVSSSLTTALSWTDGGVAKTFTGAAMTGNTTATYQGAVVPMKVDASSNVTYTLTYASAGATAMQFAWIASLENVPT